MNNIKSIKYKNKVKIITLLDNKQYVLKIRTSNIDWLYDYLDSRSFNHYLKPLTNNNEFIVYPYIEDNGLNNEDRANDLIKTVSLLHTTTTTYQDTDLDKIKEIYENISNDVNNLDSYYHDLQDYIEEKEFFSPAEYLLIRNISKIYAAIYYAKDSLEKWYESIKNSNRQRYVLLHNNLRLDHLLESDQAYLISWEKAKKDLVIYDFVNFYKNEYERIEMSSLFDLYQNKYRYTNDEYLLFTILISLPYKIELTDDNYINTLKVKRLIDYIEVGDKFLLKENEKYKKT